MLPVKLAETTTIKKSQQGSFCGWKVLLFVAKFPVMVPLPHHQNEKELACCTVKANLALVSAVAELGHFYTGTSRPGHINIFLSTVYKENNFVGFYFL